MPDINPSIPVAGQPNSTEEPKIVTALTQLVGAVNNLDTANLSATAGIVDTQLASPTNAVWRPIFFGEILISSSHTSGVAYYVSNTSGGLVASGAATTAVLRPWVPIVADVAVAGKTTRVRLRSTLIVNGIAPLVNITPNLSAVTSFTGTGPPAQIIPTLGTSPLATPFVTPGLGTTTPATSTPVDLSTLTAACYLFGCQLSGTPPANFYAAASVSLEMAHV